MVAGISRLRVTWGEKEALVSTGPLPPPAVHVLSMAVKMLAVCSGFWECLFLSFLFSLSLLPQLSFTPPFLYGELHAALRAECRSLSQRAAGGIDEFGPSVSDPLPRSTASLELPKGSRSKRPCLGVRQAHPPQYLPSPRRFFLVLSRLRTLLETLPSYQALLISALKPCAAASGSSLTSFAGKREQAFSPSP